MIRSNKNQDCFKAFTHHSLFLIDYNRSIKKPPYDSSYSGFRKFKEAYFTITKRLFTTPSLPIMLTL